MNIEGFGTKQADGLLSKNISRKVNAESKHELKQGLVFDSAEAAQDFYHVYAARAGFKIRIGQLYRSRADGSVISRRFVCSKEGFQTNARTGCPAFIRVQRNKSGKWAIATVKMDHNHELAPPVEIRKPNIQRNAPPAEIHKPNIQRNAPPAEIHKPSIQRNAFPIVSRSSEVPSTRTEIRSQDDGNNLNLTDAVNAKRSRMNAFPIVSRSSEVPSTRTEIRSQDDGNNLNLTDAAVNSKRSCMNAFPTVRSSEVPSTRTEIRSQNDGNNLNPTDAVNAKRSRTEEGEVGGSAAALVDPCNGIAFDHVDEAYKYYCSYATRMGFKVRVGQLFRANKNDCLITSRKFVCSKEGHQHPSRVGCGAFLRIQRQDSGRWVVDQFSKEHNHILNSPIDGTNDEIDLRQNNIGNDWYSILLPYFQSRQAVDTGFFYALEMDDGKCGSVFWADGRSRFLCSQFGDAIVFDTSYRSNNYSVPFAFFIGVNHHKQPVLLGCALIADESEKCYSWIFQTWIRAMSGRPLSIIADQDMSIRHSIARVFPETHHRFSAWQMKANEVQHLGPVISNNEFRYEYTICVSMSRTPTEFDSSWNQLLNKYGLQENVWLKEMYQMRKSWVPLYIKGTFFAGIPLDDGNTKSFFGNFLNAQSPSKEFIPRYEKAVEHCREKERKEDFNSFSSQTELCTKDPIEKQGRLHYTMTLFKVFQKELLECYNYVAVRINADNAINRYMVQKCVNGMEDRNSVAVNCSNQNVSCSCKMFEFEGVLCRHVLKIFQVMNIRELPSRYILHRWTKNAKCGAPRDMDSVGGYADVRTLMLWSLREEASNYIQAGATSHEKYKLAFEILYEGRRGHFGQSNLVKPKGYH